MIKHILGIVAAVAFVVLCTLLPFLPGSYDGLAVPLSEMAHMFGTVGLMLVPIGLLWIAADRSEGCFAIVALWVWVLRKAWTNFRGNASSARARDRVESKTAQF